MLVEPAIQVNFVVDAPASELHAGHVEIGEERDTDGEIGRRLFRREAPRRRERQRLIAGHGPRVGRHHRGCFFLSAHRHSGHRPR
jgi:hypothetical protein